MPDNLASERNSIQRWNRKVAKDYPSKAQCYTNNHKSTRHRQCKLLAICNVKHDTQSNEVFRKSQDDEGGATMRRFPKTNFLLNVQNA